MTGKVNGVATKFKQLDQCKTMINVHCICHRLALTCGDTGDELKFISDFEITMVQLWAFFKIHQRDLTYILKLLCIYKSLTTFKRVNGIPSPKQ